MLRNKKVYTDAQKQALWDRYSAGDQTSFTDLCEAYLSLVEIIAVRHKSVLPESIEIDDLINDGFFGLADAVTKFDPSQGNKFETYASSRIRGEIMDRLRDYDPVSRYYRGKFKQLAAVTDILSESLQRDPTDEEIAVELEWETTEVQKIRGLYLSSFSINIDDHIKDSTHEVFSLAEMLQDSTIGESGYAMLEEGIRDRLIESLSSLSEQESYVIYWKHYENLSFIEIGERLGLKVPRVSRIYAGAMKKLQAEFAS